jgi:ribonuclease-3 family protein
MKNFFDPNFTLAQVNAMSSLALALVGDGAYELLCRVYLSAQGTKTVLNLHKSTVELVKAPTQARFADLLKPHLTEEEAAFYRRGKNSHTRAHPKGATAQEYAKATGLETLFGALYLLGQIQRLNELFAICMEAE